MVTIAVVEVAAGAWLMLCGCSTINGTGLVTIFAAGGWAALKVFEPQKNTPTGSAKTK
jgi:hypothetical protein